MKNDRKTYDDGRTVADMNVPGMPWYAEKKADARPDGSGLSHDEARRVMRAVLKWLLLFWLAVSAVMIIIVFLLTRVWS